MPSYILSQLALANAPELLRQRSAGTVQRDREWWCLYKKNVCIHAYIPHKWMIYESEDSGSVNTNPPHLFLLWPRLAMLSKLGCSYCVQKPRRPMFFFTNILHGYRFTNKHLVISGKDWTDFCSHFSSNHSGLTPADPGSHSPLDSMERPTEPFAGYHGHGWERLNKFKDQIAWKWISRRYIYI